MLALRDVSRAVALLNMGWSLMMSSVARVQVVRVVESARGGHVGPVFAMMASSGGVLSAGKVRPVVRTDQVAAIA